MISGFDKYYQIAPCFRDEDPRADRAPGEFYQLDFEMAFATQEDVFNVIEELVPHIFKKFTNWKVDEGHFLRIPYREAMEKYGIDKPDLRNPLIIKDATNLFKNTEFNSFKDKTIKVIVVPKGAEQGRKFFDSMGEFAVEEAGAKGLAWVKIDEENNVTGGISKFVTDEIKTEIGAKAGDSIFFIADEFEKAQKIAGLVRIELGKRLDLIQKNVYRFCWIVDFPMYEYNEDEEKNPEFGFLNPGCGFSDSLWAGCGLFRSCEQCDPQPTGSTVTGVVCAGGGQFCGFPRNDHQCRTQRCNGSWLP